MSDEQHVQEQNDLRQRYYAHIQREEKRRIDRKGPVVRAEINTELFAEFSAQSQNVPVIEVVEKPNEDGLIQDAKTTIELAKLRTQIKKLEKQLSVREDTGKRTQLAELMQQLQDLQG
jgi:electron transport complex protein RnfB